MSVAIWRIWINNYDNKILKLYFVHLFFNMIWSIIFFGFHQIGLALLNLIIILVLLLTLDLATKTFSISDFETPMAFIGYTALSVLRRIIFSISFTSIMARVCSGANLV